MLLNDDSAKDMVVIQTLNESGDQSIVENFNEIIKNSPLNANDIMALHKSKVLPIAEENAARAEEEDAYQQEVINFLNVVNEKESEVDIHQISQDLRDLKDAQSVDRLSSFRAH